MSFNKGNWSQGGQDGDDWVVIKSHEWSNVHLIIHNTYILSYDGKLYEDLKALFSNSLILTSKSVCSFEEINDLLFCNMNMHETRKATCKKVRICATVKDCNLWISQGTMCKKEIYNTSLQDFCWFSQNQCRCYLQPNKLCDELSPTAVDGNVLGQISQPNGNKNLMCNTWDFLFWRGVRVV